MSPETVLCLPDHAHVRLLGIGVLETIGEPVGHGIAEHQHVASGAVSRLSGEGALEKSSRTRCLGACCWKGANRSPPKPATATAETATESTVAARLRPLRRSAKIEKLRGCRSDDSNQQRDRHSQRDQQARSR